jgi:hypothetical protein
VVPPACPRRLSASPEGIDWTTAPAARVAAALDPLFGNQSASAIANAFANQLPEWLTQARNAARANLSPDARRALGSESTWFQLQAARSALQDVLGSTTENFKGMLPHLEKIRERLGQIAAFIDPQVGNPFGSMALLGGALGGGFLLLRGMLGRMGPWSRTLLGGAAGMMLGGPAEGLMGALLGRSVGASGTAVAAGAAGATAGAVFGGRFMRAVVGILRGVRSFAFWTIPGLAIGAIVDNWNTVSARLQAIWSDLQAAWEAKSFTRFFQGEGVAQVGRDIEHGARSFSRAVQDLVDPPTSTSFLPRAGSEQARLMERLSADARAMAQMGFYAPGQTQTGPQTQAHGKGSVQTLNAPITINITTQTNASPQAIGDAAGGAVRSGLRQLLSDGASLTE